jgi:hypothetical protein
VLSIAEGSDESEEVSVVAVMEEAFIWLADDGRSVICEGRVVDDEKDECCPRFDRLPG